MKVLYAIFFCFLFIYVFVAVTLFHDVSITIRYGQLDSDDREVVLHCPVYHCVVTNHTNLFVVIFMLEALV